MRTLIVATLAFAPVLLQAQAVSPAPTQNAPALQSRLDAPAFPAAAKTSATPRRVSTGVVAPKLISPIHVQVVPQTYALLNAQGDKDVKVSMIIDETGVPSHIKIDQPADPYLDEAVFEAVAHSRFKPGTVSDQPMPIPVDLTITVRAASRTKDGI
jgi:TonB family protein